MREKGEGQEKKLWGERGKEEKGNNEPEHGTTPS
jgi:hypothetical protein